MKQKPTSIFGIATVLTLLTPALVLGHEDDAALSDVAGSAPTQIVDCVLEDGTQTQCAELTLDYVPDGVFIGPFCPTTLDDENTGIWNLSAENSGLYRLNRAFFEMMDGMGIQFYEDDGTVHIADIAAAQPEYDHACINVSVDESVTITALIPVDPKMSTSPQQLGTVNKVGVSLSGSPIFSDAPTIAQTGHMPALDNCGGHVDPGGWYHWHATSSDIETVFDANDIDADCNVTQNASAKFGYAFDGYAIYGSADFDGSMPTDLDMCDGHFGVAEQGHEEVYHYHAPAEFPNLPSCLIGVQAVNNFSTTAQAGIGANPPEGTEITRGEAPRGGQGGGQGNGIPPGFEQAAQALNVSTEEFMAAITAAGGRDLDFAAAAQTLGVSEDALRSALPPPPQN